MRAVVALVVVLGVIALAGARFAGSVLVVSDPLPPRADAIVILAGSVPDRVLEAADLYRAGLAPRVVVTRERVRRGDLALRNRGIRFPETDELTIDALHRLGVPDRAVLRLRRRATSTESEVRTIARWACSRHVRSLIVVTSRAHTRRARLILRQSLGPRIALTIRPSRYDRFSGRRWWHVRRDQKLVLTEWQKLVNYWLNEHWTIPPCGGLHRSWR
jgi:uncharacterized SAM-binding protein YcdF (DUF218 family)